MVARTLTAALMGGTVLVAGCAKPVGDKASPRAVDQLASVLADESIINAIMHNSTIRKFRTYRLLDGWPEGDVYSRPDCIAVTANIMEAVYRHSRPGEMRGAQFAGDGPDGDPSIDEAVVTFATAEAARAFVTATVQTWNECANTTLTITHKGTMRSQWVLGQSRKIDGVDVIDYHLGYDPSWSASHGLRATNNLVIDLWVAGRGVGDQAVPLVNAIVNRNQL